MASPDTSRAEPRRTTGEIATLLRAELQGPADLPITRLDAIDDAGPGSLTFIRSGNFASQWAASKAAAALVSRGVAVPGHDAGSRALLIVADADKAMYTLLDAFAPSPSLPLAGIHPSAIIDAAASVDKTATIGPFCIIGPRATIGPGAVLMNSVTVGPDASVGEGTLLHPNVVIEARCSVGKFCILHGSVVIGADGFGYRPTGQGRTLAKVPHLGDVRIGDRVEIGACTCIDRAKFGSTSIGSGTKIDNLVQIGHNCRVGRDCIICGLVGLSGSVTLGDGAVLAGQVGIADGVTIGAGARVGARSGVNADIPAGESWLGAPAQPMRETAKNIAVLRDIAGHIRELRKMLRADAGKP